MDTVIEIACSEIAIGVINGYAAKRKLNPLQVAMTISGVVHEHSPTTKYVETCAYCRRNGNVFGSGIEPVETNDVISRYKKKMRIIAKEMERELLDELTSKIS